MAGYNVNGQDLDILFDPIGNAAPGANVGFKIQGNDLGSIYAPISAGSAGPPTNFISGTDLNTIFAAAGTVPSPTISPYTAFTATVSPAGNLLVNAGALPSFTAIVCASGTSTGQGGYNLGVDTAGQLYMWGRSTKSTDNYVQIVPNIGLSTSYRYPLPAPGLKISNSPQSDMYKKFSASSDNMYFVIKENNTLWAWGFGGNGRLGDGTTVTKSSPVQIGTSSWAMVSATASNTNCYGIRSDGMLFAWGGSGAQIGNGTTAVEYSSPVQIGSSSWQIVSAGDFNVWAIRSDGKLFAWGLNDSGQLGVGSVLDRSSPVQVGASSWSMVGGFVSNALFVRSDGTLWGTGANDINQIATGATTSRSSPVQIGSATNWNLSKPPIIRQEDFVPASFYALDNTNNLYAWGYNTYGQLGDGNTTDRDVANIALTQSNILTIGVNKWWGMSVATDYIPYAWGNFDVNNEGVPGKLDTLVMGANIAYGANNQYNSPFSLQITGNSSPAQFVLLTNNFNNVATSGNSWKSVSIRGQAGPSVTFAQNCYLIANDDTLWVQGDNSSGQLGDGTTVNKQIPVKLGTESWKQIAQVSSAPCMLAIKSDGTLWSWGANPNGILGLGDLTSRSSPTQIGASSWNMISIGAGHALAIRSDRTLWAWGLNTNGTLGDGTTINKSSPVQIGSNYWYSISAGQSRSAAIRMDKLLFTWGNNASGALGLGNLTNRSSPVQVGTSLWNAVSMAKFGAFTHAIKADNTLWAWGSGTAGSIGDNTTNFYSSPIQIGTSSWIFINAGSTSTVGAIRSDYTYWQWGARNFGQGYNSGTTNGTSSPIQLPSTTKFQGLSYTSFSNFGGHACVLGTPNP